MQYRKKIIGLLIVAMAAIAALTIYEAAAVIKARRETPEIFRNLLADASLHLNEIPEARIKQLLQVEDPEFYQHHGVDFSAPGAGITTITQAMVKYLYFKKFRPGFKKLKQTLIAWLAVDPLVSKDDQLTVFINTAYFGTVDQKTVRGFDQAASVYFAKPFAELTDDEYLALVAMLIGPNAFSVRNYPERNQERTARIKKLLSGEYQPLGNGDVYYGQEIEF